MKSLCKMTGIVFIVPPRDQMSHSGVSTFQRQLADGFGGGLGRFRVVEISDDDHDPSATGVPVPTAGEPVRRPLPLGLYIGLGYLKTLWRDVCRVWAVRSQCRKAVILVNQFGCETLPIALRLVFPFSPIVAISHTHPGQTPEAKQWVRRMVEHACYLVVTDIIFNSNASRGEWAHKLGRVSLKGTVIHLGTEPPDPATPDGSPEARAGVVNFVSVARFASWKGQRLLVHAWQALIERGHCHARLVFVGDGPELASVRAEAESAGLGDYVVFLGAKPEAARYFNQADVAVLMSTEPEAFGLVLLEAMSRGVPVLASRRGGIPEIVVDGETGLLVEPADEARLIEAIEALMSSETLRHNLGRAGLMRWKSQFTAGAMLNRYQEYFKTRGLPS